MADGCTWRKRVNLLKSRQPLLMSRTACALDLMQFMRRSLIIFQLVCKCMHWNWFWAMEWVISILEIAISLLVWARTWHELVSSCSYCWEPVKPLLAPFLASSAKRLHAAGMAETTLSCLWVVGRLLCNGVTMTASVPGASAASAG